MTDVQTTPATTTDFEVLPRIQAELAARNLLPAEQLVDSGYLTAEHLVNSQSDHGVVLIGPTLPDPSWQAKAATGFDLSAFVIDWESKTARCPQGETSRSWVESRNAHGHEVGHVMFGRQACASCGLRRQCTKSASGPRTLTISAQPYHEALQRARQEEKTAEFKEAYRARAGVEGALSQAVRVGGMRRSRYVGVAKTHFQHLATAAALNVVRAGAWLLGRPRAETRVSAFAALAPQGCLTG